jgi:hypothetical protein
MFGLFERKSNKGMVMLLVGAGVVAVGAATFALLRNETIRRKLGLINDREAMIDATSEDSFPSSDAPSWTPTTSLGSLH